MHLLPYHRPMLRFFFSHTQKRDRKKNLYLFKESCSFLSRCVCVYIYIYIYIFFFFFFFPFLTHLRMLTILISWNSTCLALLLFFGLKTEHSCTGQLVIQESLDFHYKLLPLWLHQPLHSYLTSFMILCNIQLCISI